MSTPKSVIELAKKSGASESGLKYIAKTYPEGFIPYGADALRYTLLSYSPQSRRISTHLAPSLWRSACPPGRPGGAITTTSWGTTWPSAWSSLEQRFMSPGAGVRWRPSV